MANLAGIGIDLIDLSRIKAFVKNHSAKRLSRLLSASEQARFKKKKISALVLAKLFTAKEAYFKTLGEGWMGLDGFACMEVRLLSPDRFAVSVVDGPLAKKGPRPAEGCFFDFANCVGAQVMRWEAKKD